MKHIHESIIGKRGSAPAANLWRLDLLIPCNKNTDQLSAIRTDITRHKHYSVSDIEPYLKFKSNLAGIRGERQAIEEARKYMEYLKKQGKDDWFAKFVGITRSNGEDEPEPLGWDFVVGFDNRERIFVLENK